MPETIEEKIKTQGPDGKYYSFKKGTSQDRIDKYFTKQGWIKKGDEWYTKSGEKASDLSKVPSSTPGFTAKRPSTGLSLAGSASHIGVDLVPKEQRQESDTKTALGSSLGTVGGFVGGIAGGTPGAGLGGATGEAIRQLLVRPTFLEKDASGKKAVYEVMKEAALQAGSEKLGQLTGKVIFKILDKIPHAKMIEKIPFLPSEYKNGGRVYKYVEDLLTNLIPSSKTMEGFKSSQAAALDKSLDTLVKGMGHFKGTSADLGELLQGAVRTADKSAYKAAISDAMKSGIKTEADFYKSAFYQQYKEVFKNTLLNKISKTESPSLIAGYIRNKTVGSEENIRHLVEVLAEQNPKLLDKTRAFLMRDMVSEAIKGSADPVAKQAVKGQFTGQGFKKILDNIGEERLKALYGQDGFDAIENFVSLTSRIGGASNGAGRFLNLAILLPIRNGLNAVGLTHIAQTSLIVNRLAKVITSTEGMKLYQKEIEASAKQLPRLANLAREEIKAFNEKSDREYELEKEQEQQEYLKEKEKYKK